MAQRNLRAAADAVAKHPKHAAAHGADLEEAAAWREAAESMLVPYDARRGVHAQAENFTELELWDFEHTGEDQYPLLLHFPYFQLYRKRVVKQADLVLAMHLRGDFFTAEQKARNFDYYDPLTVRDSSLSACTLAYDYFSEAAVMDLEDVEHNTRDVLHIASLAGAWIAVVAGFGGMRDHDGSLTFAPRLPARISRATFRLTYRGRCLVVTMESQQAEYRLTDGPPLDVTHHGEELTVTTEDAVTRAIPPVPVRESPSQPRGREPGRRRT